MKWILRNCLVGFFLVYCQHAMAVSYYCDNTGRNVNSGDSTAVVTQNCGAPTSMTAREDVVSQPIQVTEWVYSSSPLSTKTTETVRPFISVMFSNSKVTQVQKGGTAITSDTIYCSLTGTIHIGDTQDSVRQNCGSPTYVNVRQIANNVVKKYKVWTYNFGPYRPQIIFTFDEQGNLQDIKAGQLGN